MLSRLQRASSRFVSFLGPYGQNFASALTSLSHRRSKIAKLRSDLVDRKQACVPGVGAVPALEFCSAACGIDGGVEGISSLAFGSHRENV
jgi:hypothetical protein